MLRRAHEPCLILGVRVRPPIASHLLRTLSSAILTYDIVYAAVTSSIEPRIWHTLDGRCAWPIKGDKLLLYHPSEILDVCQYETFGFSF